MRKSVTTCVGRASRGRALSADLECAGADRRVPIGHREWVDTRKPFRWARWHLRMSLAALRLRHGRRSAVADPELATVVGSDPPFGMPGTASGKVGMGTPMPPSPGGRSRSNDPSGKSIRRRYEAADHQFDDRPAGVSALSQRTGRGPAENARPWAAGERRALLG